MEDIVAVKIKDSKSVSHYFITWGRIFDRVDPKSLERVVATRASECGIKNVKSVTICDSLQEAAKSRYFYEALFEFSQKKIPCGKTTYNPWCAKMKKLMLSGREIYYCGAPKKNV